MHRKLSYPPARETESTTPLTANDWLLWTTNLCRAMVRAGRRMQIVALASSLAFLSLLAIVPVATAMLLVLASVPAFAELRDQFQAFLAQNFLLPQVADAVMGHITDFAAAAGRLSLVGIAVFLATAVSTMLTVDHTLNEIWNSPAPRPIIYRLLIYWAALTLGPLALAALVAMRLDEMINTYGGGALGAPVWLPWVITTLLLGLFFRVVPNRPVRLVHALAGAALAALLIELLKNLLQFYITAFPTYQAVYGAFSVLPVLLLWLFSVWLAVLVGALLAANLGYPEVSVGATRPAEEFERGRTVIERLAAAASDGTALPVSTLRDVMQNNPEMADRVGHALARLGYLARVTPAARGRSGDEAGESAAGGWAGASEFAIRAPDAIWREHWMASPGLAAMSLRPLHDEIWQRGRLEATPVKRPRRFFGWQLPRVSPAATPSAEDVRRLDAPLSAEPFPIPPPSFVREAANGGDDDLVRPSPSNAPQASS
jgi:membrane protein